MTNMIPMINQGQELINVIYCPLPAHNGQGSTFYILQGILEPGIHPFSLPTYLPTYLPIYLPTYLPTYQPTYIYIYRFNNVETFHFQSDLTYLDLTHPFSEILIYRTTYLITYLQTCMHAYIHMSFLVC